MVRTLSRPELQQLRFRAQRLVSSDAADAAALVASMVAIQSQEKASSVLAIRPRLPGSTAAAVQAELEDDRRLLRTWTLRGTLHIVASEDVRWLLPLLAPRLLANSQRRYRQLELDEETLATATDLLTEALDEDGPLTRAELGAYLEEHGVSTEGQRLPHLLRRAALLGLICFGPEREGVETYVLLDEWLDSEGASPEDGWQRLAGRYLAAYGPVSVDDFATWSGAYKGEAREAFAAMEDELEEVEAEGESLWMVQEQAERLLPQASSPLPPALRLLPAYDPLLLGYQSRDWLVQQEYARAIHPGGGFLRPTLVVDGEAAGTWKMARRRSGLQVTVQPFAPLTEAAQRLLRAEVEDLGRFLEAETALKTG